MLRIKTLAAVAVMLPFALIQPASAQGTPLSANDYVQIYNLYTAYCWALDRGNGAALAATFAPGGTERSLSSHHTPQPVTSVAAQATKDGPSTTRHVMANIELTPTADGVNGRAYGLVISGQVTPGTITGSPALYHDTLVKTASGWRFKTREIWLDQEKDSPYLGKPASSPVLGLGEKP